MFNKGDKVRFISNSGTDMTEGGVYEVTDTSSYNVCVLDDVKEHNWCHATEFERVSEDSQELQELRAFKAAALARFPALAEPETDDEASTRFVDEMLDNGTYYDTVIEAFKWARANPR